MSTLGHRVHEREESMSFRLLTIEENYNTHSASDARRESRHIPISHSDPHASRRESWTSVVVGRNGLGKSRALGGAARLFSSLDMDVPRLRTAEAWKWNVKYIADGRSCELWSGDRGHVFGTVDGIKVDTSQMPRPRRVIALTNTVTDKFPLESTHDAGNSEASYVYLGLRDRSGRASSTSVAIQAIEALTAAAEYGEFQRARVVRIFSFLGYEPEIRHRYRWHYAIADAPRDPEAFAAWAQKSKAFSGHLLRLRDRLRTDSALAGRLIRGIQAFEMNKDSSSTTLLTIDLSRAGNSSRESFDDIQFLKRHGLVRLKSLELKRVDSGVQVDLQETSSGELALATSLLALAANMDDDALVLIDEPEVSLHPEWQTRYISLVADTFAEFSGAHFVIATHSPLVVSSVPEGSANVVSLDTESPEEASGESIDELLVTTFGVTTENNLFIKQKLVEALRLAADGGAGTDRFASIVDLLVSAVDRLDPESPVRTLVSELASVGEGDPRAS